MNGKAVFISVLIGVIAVFPIPMTALILVYVHPAIFINIWSVLFRWAFLIFPILFLTGVAYDLAGAAFPRPNGKPTDGGGAYFVGLLVGLAGTFSEVVARIIPQVLVALHIIGWTYVPMDAAEILFACIGFSVASVLGGVAGVFGAEVSGWVRKRVRRPAPSAV